MPSAVIHMPGCYWPGWDNHEPCAVCGNPVEIGKSCSWCTSTSTPEERDAALKKYLDEVQAQRVKERGRTLDG